jgi:hypothetical protein
VRSGLPWRERLADTLRLVHLSARSLAGRRYWIVALIPLVWVWLQALFVVARMRETVPGPDAAQGELIGLPATILGLALGVRVIAGEIDRRTLEIAYTVPGGAQRVWLAKLAAAAAMLAVSVLLVGLEARLVFTEFPIGALYGAFQGALFYLALGTGLATLFKSEATGALVGVGVLIANGVITGFGENQLRVSPLWNPAALDAATPEADVLAWTVQNRVGFALAIMAIVALSIVRAERRETMLSG